MNRVFLVDRNGEKRDITDIFSGYFYVADGVRVSYHSSYINGKLMSNPHQTLHRNCCIQVMEVER